MKKIFVLATVFLFLCSIDCFAAKISNDITDRTWNGNYNTTGVIPSKDDGKWKYPCVGASAGETTILTIRVAHIGQTAMLRLQRV